jgi:dienelactone hydrolase
VRNAELPGYKTHVAPKLYKSRAEWEQHRAAIRTQILCAAGLFPMPERTPLHTRVVRTLRYPGYSIATVQLETLPGYFLGGNLYMPESPAHGSRPAVLIAHGHWKHGRIENTPSYSVPALGIGLARQGYVAFAYDMVGFNDTRQTPHDFLNRTYSLWSFTPMGLQLWNSIRALDYLESLPGVDRRRIAMTGASGGASQTIFLAAVDDRISLSAPVNMISAYMQGGDPCEEAPTLRLGTSNVEIAAAAAPRPMIVVSSTHDWTRHNSEEEIPAIRQIYSLYGRQSNIEHVQFDAEHNYNARSREAVYRFLAAQLHPENASIPRELADSDPPPDADLLAHNDATPTAESIEHVFEQWRSQSDTRRLSRRSAAELRMTFGAVFAAEYPSKVEARTRGSSITISRPDRSDLVAGYWRPGKGRAAVYVHPEGVDAALRSDVIRQLLKSGRPVLILNPFRPDAERVRRERADAYFLSYNRTDDAELVQDILTALSFVRANSKGSPDLIGVGVAGIRCVFAAAIAPVNVNLFADVNGFAGWDSDFLDNFYVPGIQRAGGLPAALKLVNNGHILLASGD